MFKSKDECISIFGLKTKFGGGRSTGFALVYDSTDARKKYDSKKMLRRVRFSLLFSYLILGRLPCQSKELKKAKKGDQGKSRQSQRYCQGKGCLIWWKEEVSRPFSLRANNALFSANY